MYKNNDQPQKKRIINNDAHEQLQQVQTKFPVFTTTCRIYYCAVRIRAQYISQLKTVGRSETCESWPSKEWVNSK